MSSHPSQDPAVPRACQNCGATLTGPYCANCGQHDVDYHRSFHYLLHDLLENLFHFEGKFFVSVAWLLAKPGRLTREFVSGRRQSQLNPLRFYLFVSVLFFLGLTWLNHGHVFDYDAGQASALTTQFRAGERDARREQRALTPAEAAEVARRAAEATRKSGAVPEAMALAAIEREVRREAPVSMATNGTRPAQIRIDRRSPIGRALSDKLASGELTFGALFDELEHRIPTLLFLGVPLFALLLKLLYFRAGRFYIEHLIFSLHLHTWLFLGIMVGDGYVKLAGLVSGWLALAGVVALFGWMAWYLASSFRAVYGQGWVRTVLKLMLLGGTYALLLLFVAALLVTATIYWITLE